MGCINYSMWMLLAGFCRCRLARLFCCLLCAHWVTCCHYITDVPIVRPGQLRFFPVIIGSLCCSAIKYVVYQSVRKYLEECDDRMCLICTTSTVVLDLKHCSRTLHTMFKTTSHHVVCWSYSDTRWCVVLTYESRRRSKITLCFQALRVLAIAQLPS